MPLMGQYFYSLYVIGASEYPCWLHILLVSHFVSIHAFTSDASLFHSPKRIICSPWCIHFQISVLIFIQNRVLGLFWIFMIAKAWNFWLCDPPALPLTVGQYVVMIPILKLIFACSIIHDRQPRFLNSWPVVIPMHDTSSTDMMGFLPL